MNAAATSKHAKKSAMRAFNGDVAIATETVTSRNYIF